MAKSKVKRYNGEDDSDVRSFAGTPENESNAGMKEAYEAGMTEKEPGWDTKESGMTEKEPGWDTKESAKPRTVSKAAPKASQTFPMTPAPKYEPKSSETKKAPSLGRAGQGSGFERSTEKYDKLKKDIEARQKSSVTNPSILSRLFSTSSQRSRPYKTETMAKGGSASSRADGIAQRGKTRGKMIMCGGGKI